MTTTCLPCEMAAAEAVEDVIPETTGDQKATWSGPIGIEAQVTGDGRLIEANALRWDTLPVPLRWAPQDFGAHDGAVVVGKIEEIERLSYEEANERLIESGRDALPESFSETIILWGSGEHDLGSKDGREAHRQVKEGLTPGISMDLDDIVVSEEDDEGLFRILEGRVRAATQVAIPAFEGARISVSEPVTLETDDEDEASFNWVDDVGGLPQYIKRIEKHLTKKGMTESHAIATAVNAVKKMCATGDLNFPGAQDVNAGSRAEACAAVAEWEEKKARAHADSAESITASAKVPPAEWFKDPVLAEPTGLTVTEDGRVYGHIALWGTCHIANPQGSHVCTQPPRSVSNYSYFRTGVTTTTAGDVATGKITMSTLHANDRLSASDTVYHYEHTGAVGADVVAGEDSFGIWVAGAARSGADLVALKAAPVSGDWRTIGGALELVGALSVNVPGFPVPRARALIAGGTVRSLIASGVVKAQERTTTMGTITVNLGADLSDEALLALRDRFREMDRKERADALAAKVNRLAALERVRRTAASFAFNKDQWRVPKGNGRESGRFIDMPDGLLDDLSGAFDDAGIKNNPDLDAAKEAAKSVSDALRAGDGDQAKEMADRLDEELSVLESALQDDADSGALNPDEAATIGDFLAEVQKANDAVRDSDLSLLGDEMIGEDAPETDIGADDVIDESGRDADGEIVGEDPLSPADLLGEAGIDQDTIDEAENMWGGFKREYEKNANPDEDPAPDVLEESFYQKVAAGTSPSDALREINEELQQARTGETPDATPDAPSGTAQQVAGNKAVEGASALEGALQDAADNGLSEQYAPQVGDALEEYRDALDKLNAGIQSGNYNAADLQAAQAALADLEAVMMTAADAPDGSLSEEGANNLGIALDKAFEDLNGLTTLLQGEMEPPPFSSRRLTGKMHAWRGLTLTLP